MKLVPPAELSWAVVTHQVGGLVGPFAIQNHCLRLVQFHYFGILQRGDMHNTLKVLIESGADLLKKISKEVMLIMSICNFIHTNL